MTNATPSNRNADLRPGPDDRPESERNRSYGAALRKLYRSAMSEPLPPEFEDTLRKLK